MDFGISETESHSDRLLKSVFSPFLSQQHEMDAMDEQSVATIDLLEDNGMVDDELEQVDGEGDDEVDNDQMVVDELQVVHNVHTLPKLNAKNELFRAQFAGFSTQAIDDMFPSPDVEQLMGD